MGSVLRNHAVAERLPHENPEQLLSLEGRKVGHTGETLSTRQAYSRNIRVSGSQGPSYYAVGVGVAAPIAWTPPSTWTISPVIARARSESRKRAASATGVGSSTSQP